MATATAFAAPRGDRGAAAVEFALVSLLFLTLAFATMQYGTFFWQLQSAEHAAREGARLAAVGVDDCADFAAAVMARAGGADPQGVTMTIAPAQAPAADPDGEVGPGSTVTVGVRWRPLTLPVALVPVPFVSGSEHVASGVARVEVVGGQTSCA